MIIIDVQIYIFLMVDNKSNKTPIIQFKKKKDMQRSIIKYILWVQIKKMT